MKAIIKLGFLCLFLSLNFACSKRNMISQVLEEKQDFITDKIGEQTEIAETTTKENIVESKGRTLKTPRILKTSNPITLNPQVEEEKNKKPHLVMFEEIETKILFHLGQSVPNSIGVKNIDYIFKDLKADLLEHKKLFPDDVIVLDIIITGYSDSQPFYQGQLDAERKKMNKKISYKRAKNVGDFLKDHLETYVDEVEEVLIAKGEELPTGVTVGMVKDARRRMCLVDLRVYAKK